MIAPGEIPVTNPRVLTVSTDGVLRRKVQRAMRSSASTKGDDLSDMEWETDYCRSPTTATAVLASADSAGDAYSVVVTDLASSDQGAALQRMADADPNTQFILAGLWTTMLTLPECLRHRVIIISPTAAAEEVRAAVETLSCKWTEAAAARAVIDYQEKVIQHSCRMLQMVRGSEEELQGECRELKDQVDELSVRIQAQMLEVLGTREITCLALSQLAESRDPETGEHLLRMQAFSQLLARDLANNGPYQDQITEEFLDDLWRSSPLHDIGKVGIPDSVLLKPGRLSAAEFDLMKMHTILGAEVLQATAGHNQAGRFLLMAVRIARSHHERMDGNGYPDRLLAQEIPLEARIVAVADVFDALTSKRIYKDAIDPDEARRIINRDSGSHFDPEVIAAFERCFDDLVAERRRINETLLPDEIDAATQFSGSFAAVLSKRRGSMALAVPT